MAEAAAEKSAPGGPSSTSGIDVYKRQAPAHPESRNVHRKARPAADSERRRRCRPRVSRPPAPVSGVGKAWLASRPESRFHAAKWERRRAVRWKEAEASGPGRQPHLRANQYPASLGCRNRYPCGRAHPWDSPGDCPDSESQPGSGFLPATEATFASGCRGEVENPALRYAQQYTSGMFLWGMREKPPEDIVFLGRQTFLQGGPRLCRPGL